MKYIYWILFLAVFGISGQYFGSEAVTVIQKGLLFVTVLFAAAYFGISVRRLKPLGVFAVSVSISSIGALMVQGASVDLGLLLKSFFSLSLVFLVFSLRLNARSFEYAESAICALPFVSIFSGFVFFFLIGLSPWMSEFTGVSRLRGASIPPHLAMMAVIAYFFLQMKFLAGRDFRKIDIFLLIGQLVVILLTGTRGALIVIAISAVPLFLKLFRGRGGAAKLLMITPALLVMFFAAYQIISARNEGSVVEGEQDFSGRLGAWAFFYEKYERYPEFGYGIGAVTEMTKDNVEEYLHAFVVPHNEYLRFLVDIGYVGSSIFFFGLFYCFVFYLKAVPSGDFRRGVVWMFLSVAVYSFFDNTVGTLCFAAPFALLLNAVFGVYRRVGR